MKESVVVMLDFLEPYVMTFVVMYGIAKAVLFAMLIGIAALAFVLLDTLLACAMGD